MMGSDLFIMLQKLLKSSYINWSYAVQVQGNSNKQREAYSFTDFLFNYSLSRCARCNEEARIMHENASLTQRSDSEKRNLHSIVKTMEIVNMFWKACIALMLIGCLSFITSINSIFHHSAIVTATWCRTRGSKRETVRQIRSAAAWIAQTIFCVVLNCFLSYICEVLQIAFGELR